MKESFTRAEVKSLLRKQIKASATSFDRLPVNMELIKGVDGTRKGGYLDELFVIQKRLNEVHPIKF